MIKVKKRKFLLLPGDGIGPEVIGEVKKIITWFNVNKSLDFDMEEALVGGASGTLISNQIAFHMKTTLDWSFASAMGLMLLTGVLVIYWIYNKLVGVDNIKLG